MSANQSEKLQEFGKIMVEVSETIELMTRNMDSAARAFLAGTITGSLIAKVENPTIREQVLEMVTATIARAVEISHMSQEERDKAFAINEHKLGIASGKAKKPH